ncbi:SRPBCC family protein [uncultured Pseudokineococcus sp.]|uniref:SRPBCC family protein n=1 Tax=uncultured Pseudokineococcus sp. TaxID=1642928 RepID=UPI0026089668|nr:SRPBCC family protein [uncultured Pseudokineococcus sp.]
MELLRRLSLTTGAAGAAPVEEAWERYAQPALWSTWSPQIRSVDLPARIAPGVRGAVHGPGGLRADVVVEDVDEQRRTWSWSVVLGRPGVPGVGLHLDHAVEAAPGGGCSTSLVLTGPAPVVLGYAPAAWWALRRLVRP